MTDLETNSSPAVEDAPESGEVSKPNPLLAVYRQPLVWFWICLTACIVWWISLISMAILTANPVTLNRVQLSRADVIVVASLEFPETAMVDSVLRGEVEAGTSLTVRNLSDLSVTDAGPYILALSKLRSDRYEIVGGSLDMVDPIIYPATDEVVETVRTYLEKSPEADPE
ncbi:hypothetical protein [Calycomorphotria hydatis]|uniref:Uncharacterized protein n=1 Tax=Calycomorphotria hydatis TaxID=2528027 RepID=A0A517T815_9PLAN|nr:hypothetical protein [Calycomorphotria hydatis]QDT64524.1 hypothetical protein V22_17590 [Calycomorphotria hydatis]